MSFNNKPATLLAAVLLACAGSVQADVTLYTSQASFLAAVTNAGTDTYNDMTGTVQSPAPRMAGSHAYTMATYVGSQDGLPDQPDSIHPVSLDGSNVFIVSNGEQLINFNGFTDISAIGGNFFGQRFSGSSTAPINLYLVVYDSSGYHDWYLNNVTSSSFFGVVSTGPITGFGVGAKGIGGVWTAVDNLTLAQAVPESQSYALMLGGLGLLGALASRRSRRQR